MGDSLSLLRRSSLVPSTVRHVTFDCSDPDRLAQFWADVLDGELHPDDQPGDPEAVVQSAGNPTLLFQRVPEGNRPEVRDGAMG